MPRKPKTRVIGRKGFPKYIPKNYFGVLFEGRKYVPVETVSVKELKITRK